jgi:hypothetical protein
MQEAVDLHHSDLRKEDPSKKQFHLFSYWSLLNNSAWNSD